MVYTLTLNPALDRTLYVESLKTRDSNRVQKEERYAGGKGIDVSRALVAMGIPNTALGFVGGFGGKELEGRLLNEGIHCDFIPIAGETRTNVIIQDLASGSETALLAQGPEVQPVELMNLVEKLEGKHDLQFLVMSGSLPPGLTPEVYRRLIQIGNSKGARTLLDASGEALRHGIRARPSIIKPNRAELAEMAQAEFADIRSIIRYCRSIQDQVQLILVSLGADGMLLVSDAELLQARPPKVEVRSTVGAGDCSVAGFVAGLTQGKSLTECLCLAVAAGTAATLTPGTGLCRCPDIDRLLSQVAVETLGA